MSDKTWYPGAPRGGCSHAPPMLTGNYNQNKHEQKLAEQSQKERSQSQERKPDMNEKEHKTSEESNWCEQGTV